MRGLTTQKAVITTLEMTRPPLKRHSCPIGLQPVILKMSAPDIAYYKYLYRAVGRKYQWVSQELLSQNALTKVLEQASTQIYVLYLDGTPAGFYEVDFSEQQKPILVHFGLLEHWQGRGVGKFLLSHALDVIWSNTDVKSCVVSTCSLDHPVALRLYQRAGFEVISQIEKELHVYQTLQPLKS
jgi:GNAT superfamily N-acetyltransferase